MRDLASEIPDVDLLMALTPEELAGKLLFVLRRHLEGGAQYLHLSNTLSEVTGNFGNDAPYPINRAAEVKVAISEAWLYLVAQGMIIPAVDGNGNNGFSILSR